MSTDVHPLNPAPAAQPVASANDRPSSAPGQVPPPLPTGVPVEDSEEPLTWTDVLWNPSATGYYLSLGLHILAYAIAAILFAIFSSRLLDQDTDFPPIRASLDELDRLDDRPQFESVPDIDMTQGKSESAIERMSNSLQLTKDGLTSVSPEDLVPSFSSTQTEGETPGGADFLFKMPESGLAVTKGSFTVWSNPEVPRPGEPYKLIVEIRLPDKIKAYRINDLSGQVIGTDDYKQSIPYDANAPNNSFYTNEEQKEVRITSGSEPIKVRDNKIQLVIVVPPARRLVKDTIRIRSRRLREKQELELVFGGRR